MQPRNNCKFSVYSLLKNEIKTRRSHVYKNFRISLKICDQPMSLFHIILYLSTVVAANRNSRTTFLNHRSNRMTSFSISIYLLTNVYKKENPFSKYSFEKSIWPPFPPIILPSLTISIEKKEHESCQSLS